MPKQTTYRAIKNLRSNDSFELGGKPWEATIPARPGLAQGTSKEDYRTWCSEPKTDWVFYSLAEGLTPSLRISETNPVKYQHGIVADYDAIVPIEDAKKLVEANSATGLAPTAISQTFSGGIRLVWEFEEPLMLDNKALYEAFMAYAGKEIKIKKLLPHFDETSYKSSQVFEIGNNWESIPGSVPIPSNAVHHWLAESALKAKKVSNDTSAIPYERIAAQIEKQYPGRIQGDIHEGLRVPLFWVDDGIDRIGAVLGEHGVICFSDRAGKSFVTWGEIFGKNFISEYEAERTGAAAADFWYDGRAYWVKDDALWCRLVTEEMGRRLKVLYRLSSKNGTKETSSEIDKAMVAIQQTKRVQNVAPFIYCPEEIVSFNGLKYLNISQRKMMEPASEDGDFPWLKKFLLDPGIWDEAVDSDGVGQRDYFLAWLKRFWESGRAGRLLSGQMLFIAGEAGQGKTFLSSFIMGQISGGHSDASGFLLGGGDFNKELVEVGVWSVDDGMATIDGTSRKTFSANVKKVVAQTEILYHPKFQDATKLPWQGRVVVTCNTDAESLSIVPTTDNSITDKLMLFKLGQWYPDFPPNHVIEAQVKAELPFFLRWLSAWTPPRSIMAAPGKSRYGVKSFHHPEILAHSQSLAAATHLREDIDALRHMKDNPMFDAGAKHWEGTSGDLLRLGRDFFATKASAAQIGVWLAQIHKSNVAPWLDRVESRSRKTLWTIAKPHPHK
jgi:hypothetical protein